MPVFLRQVAIAFTSCSLYADDLPLIAKADAIAKAINDTGGQAVSVPGDILNAQYINELVKKAANFGGGKINIIVNNAGFTWDAVIHKVWLLIQKLF